MTNMRISASESMDTSDESKSSENMAFNGKRKRDWEGLPAFAALLTEINTGMCSPNPSAVEA